MPANRDHSKQDRKQLTLLLRIQRELTESAPTLTRAIEDLKIEMDEEDVLKVERGLGNEKG